MFSFTERFRGDMNFLLWIILQSVTVQATMTTAAAEAAAGAIAFLPAFLFGKPGNQPTSQPAWSFHTFCLLVDIILSRGSCSPACHPCVQTSRLKQAEEECLCSIFHECFFVQTAGARLRRHQRLPYLERNHGILPSPYC